MTCFHEWLVEQVRNADRLLKDAIEHGDRKGKWFAEGKLEASKTALKTYEANGPNW